VGRPVSASLEVGDPPTEEVDIGVWTGAAIILDDEVAELDDEGVLTGAARAELEEIGAWISEGMGPTEAPVFVHAPVEHFW
jgi:hypothetical protein